MKVLYIGNGLTHYYNLVLSRLNREHDVELVVVVPSEVGGSIGEGVHQTMEGINFKVIKLEETRRFKLYTTFKGLMGVLLSERPDEVVVIDLYLRAFLFDIPVVMAMKLIQAGLILKAIPFQCSNYEDKLKSINETSNDFASLSSFSNKLLRKLGLVPLVNRCALVVYKRTLNLPDAYVNYVEAYEFWESYGISREKIFITRNSPDTDMFFATRDKIETMPSILPVNKYRMLHVGRLVQWKRVDMLLRAFAQVRHNFPSSELLIIGSGPEEVKLKNLSQELGLGSSVKFLGGVYDQETLGRYYLACSFYVLAGMGGLSINEAMCFGRPILCSVCDGTEKILVEEGINGRYFKDGDELDLVEKITWFFENVDRLPTMGLKSEEIIRDKVNIRTVLDGYLNALEYVENNK
jgi:glycosyltransferase involved in cell wall biosynthesis